jgi:hypothetical protein
MLTDLETTRRSVTTGEYIDLCDTCFYEIEDDVPTVDNGDVAISESFESAD